MTSDELRISQIGMKARSPEGHAAKGMQIKGHEDLWVDIQNHTFKNWVNEHLKVVGLHVEDLVKDLSDGTKLCALIEILQKRKLKHWIKKPTNQHQFLENVTCALNAVNEDGIKLVNIGNVDIVNGNLKLILGLIWSLIVHYQIGRSKFPPKKLMLGWLKAAVPECRVNNFTTDWNSGIALSALLDYCEPGLFPHWKYLDPNDRVDNCRSAMELARSHFNIPMVLEPEYLASPHLDELSGMTYLSYFMKDQSAGFRSTLAWVNSQLKDHTVSNFTTDWNDGKALSSLVKSLGASAKYTPSSDPAVWETNLEKGIAAGKRLGVEPILSAKHMADQHVEHLGVMAYAASFQWVKPRTNPGLSVSVSYDAHTTRIYQPTNFRIDFLSGEIDTKDVTAEIRGPEATKLECRLTLNQEGGTGTFTPAQIGMHRVSIMCEGEEVKGSPFYIRAMPQLSAITHTGLDPCAVGSIVEVLVNSNGAKAGLVEVEATSPTGRMLPCPVNERDGIYSATFQPDEAGEWSIAVLHAGQLIQGGPFTCFVFDPHGVELRGLDKPAYPESIFNFTIDARATGGLGNIVIDIVHGKKSLPHTIESLGGALYKVSLHTYQPGKYRIYVYFNGNTVKGSPFPLRVGSRDQIQKEREKYHSYKSSKHDKSYDKSYDKIYDKSYDKSHDKYDRYFESKMDKSGSLDGGRFERSSGFDSHNSFEKQFATSTALHNGYHESSPSPTRFSPLHNSSSSPNYFRTITSPVQTSSSFTSHHSTSHNLKVPVNGYSSYQGRTNQDGSALNSPPLVRGSPLSPLHSPVSHSSFTFNTHNHIIDTSNSSNMRVSTKSSSSTSKNSWDFLGNKSNSLFDTGSLIAGDALQLMPVHRNSTLSLNSEAPLSQINVTVTSPSKSNVPVRLSRSLDGTKIHFTPTDIGEHYIDVKIYDTRITGSPFRSHAYNAQAIKVAPIPDGVVGHPVEFEIDGSEAGSGNLEILVNGGHVTSFVRNLGNQRFLASFVPHESRVHLIDMKFNGESCPGSPWSVSVMTGSGLGPKMSVIGESVRLVPVNQTSVFQISALGFHREDIQATVISPSKRSLATQIFAEGSSGIYRIEFTPTEVGSHVLDVTLAGDKLQGGPLVAKAYNAGLIKVSEVTSGIVGTPCQFKVDASDAGEGQLEISVNEGEVPNHVTVIGGGKCLVSFTPQHSKAHIIDIKFNGETVEGCPLLYSISDMSRVQVNLNHLQLIPVSEVATFHMNVDSNTSAQLSVAVTGPTLEIPVKVTGNVHDGFTAEFTPVEVGAHNICVDYNGHPVYGTPFSAKVYDSRKVHVGTIPQGHVGNTLQFSVDASQAGEGNLEITISARGTNIPTQVHSHGNAKFSVSFVPLEPLDHVISIQFNKEHVPGSPFMVPVVGDFPLVTGAALSAAPVNTTSHFTLSNVAPASLDDVEVNVEAPNGQSIPAQVKDVGGSNFRIEFTPKIVGEHKINVNYGQVPVTGSPYSCKVYDVNAIRVKPVDRGIVGHPVTFIVETSQAGPGNLEVTVNGGRVATTAQAQGPHTYAISFTPRSAHPHTVDLRFNSHDVPGSPFTTDILEAARVILSSEDKVPVHRTTRFLIDTPHPTNSSLAPTVQVLSPSRQSVPVTVALTGDNSGRYQASFTPTTVGDHSVEVKLGDSQVEGSPFLVKAYDTSKVRVTDINSGVVGKPVYFSINASQAGAGNLEIIVSVNDCNVPNYVQSEGNAKFRVNFKPKEAAEHNLSVRFNGEPIPGSPFQCKILESGQVVVGGPGIRSAPVGAPAKISIDLPSPANECSVSVVAPSGRTILTNVGKQENHVTAQYVPTEIGRYTVTVEVDGHPVKDSPFICNVYNVNNIKVTGLGSAKIGKPVTFSVDATEAGEGTLELVVSTEQSTVKAEVVAMSRGLYDVTFVPHSLLSHFVNISFNEQDVPGSPYKCDIQELPSKKGNTATARGEGLNQVMLGATAYFEINPHTPEHGHIDATVIGPDKKKVPITLDKLETGLYRAKYRPIMVGTHTVTVTQKKQPITKQPWIVQVFDPLQVKILDLTDALCNRAASFKVDTRGAGSGALTVNIRAAGAQVKHTIQELETPGVYQIVYQPQAVIPHRIIVKYNNMNISGCPMEVAVVDPAVGREPSGSGLGLYQARAGLVNQFTLETCGVASSEFDVIVTSPQGEAVPVRCYQQKYANLLAEFTPTSTGVYKIDVLQGARPVRGSPYLCQVYDASKVKIEHAGISNIVVNDPISFKLLRKAAGFAELDVVVRSPLGQDLPLLIKSLGDDTDLIELVPSLPGSYCFVITYGGDAIPDSPLTFNVLESGIARAYGPGLSKGLENKVSRFIITARGLASRGDRPQVRIQGPDKNLIKHTLVPASTENEYEVSYTPSHVGIYDVHVLWNDKHITGSPFRCFVVNVDKIRVLGEPNLLSGSRLSLPVHNPTKITLDVTDAGPGEVTGSCEGPHGSTIPLNIECPGPDIVTLTLTPRSPGPHSLSLLYGGYPLPHSPYPALAESSGGGVRVVLAGKGLASATCGSAAEFTIDGAQAGPGMPEVTLTGMKSDIKVSLASIGENVYRATYNPDIPGAYLLNVMWSDRQVKGCPLKVVVGAVCDASQVLCSGAGLSVGTLGQDIRSFIDTRRAGPGELSAHCVGPSKVAYCELYDHSDATFTLNVKPQESGRHVLTVKYGGVDVPGSPFTVRVSGAPDASKVRVYGPGIEHGVLATFQSRFICDTRGAGAGQLTVRVRGPKGAFRVEMQRESQKDRTILCKFDPTEPGDYRVEIKWAGEHVPGSPFTVMIVDTQEELTRFLQGSQSPGSDMYGSVAYSTGYAHITP